MRAVHSFVLTLALSSVTFASSGTAGLPPEVHPGFIEIMESARQAHAGGETHKALAMLKGISYPEGVTIKLDQAAAGQRAGTVARALQRAVHVWHKALDGDSPVRLVVSNDTAEVKVVVTPQIPEANHDTLGLIDLKKQYRWSRNFHEVKNIGTIYLQKAWDGAPLTENQMAEVLAHEIGHLLGLGDVDTVGNLMGPMVAGRVTLEPKPHELRAVQKLRAEANTLIRQYSLSANLAAYSNPLEQFHAQSSHSHRKDYCRHAEKNYQVRRCIKW